MALLCGAAQAQPDPAFRVHRFDEDFTALADPARRADALDGLKHIGLGFAGGYLSLGGELRERYEWTRNPGFAVGRQPGAPRSNDYLLQRALLHADLHLGEALRVFVQLGSLRGFGATPGTLSATQENRFDVVQAFADVVLPLATQTRLTLRGGRQEMALGSGRLVSERDGPNLRRAFDGGRGILALPGGYRVDAFAMRPVQPLLGSFNDRGSTTEALWGIYATGPIPGIAGLSADLYYLGTERGGASFAQGTGFAQRHTLGARLFGRRGAWDWDYEAALQVGRFRGGAISAWTLASDTGFTLSHLPWQPRLGLKLDIASGDGNPRDRTLGTFDALYPKVPYFTEAGLVAPANIIDVFPSIRAQPTPAVTLELGWDFLWRQTTADAVYRAVPFVPLRGTAGGGGAWIGHQLQLSARWSITRRLELRAWAVHFTAGDAITRAGGRNVDFVAASLAFRF